MYINRRSPPRLDRFKELTTTPERKQGLSPLLDVCTRWGSTYVMIERALLCKDAYCSVLLEDNLDQFILEEVEWRRLGSLRDLLQRFDQLTTKVCASKSYVTITMTVVVYNNLMAMIEGFLRDNKERLPDICCGAQAAYDKLKKYYAATDDSPIYSVATAIHPAMRFRYWTDQRWGAKYERTAKRSVRTVWTDQYARVDTGEDLTQPLPDPSECEGDVELALLGMTGQPDGDELESFVSSPVVRETPLIFWKKKCDSYPKLSKMARDFFAIPATSAPSERCFSKARSLLPYTRNRLGPSKIQEQMLLDSWFDYFNRKSTTI
jgi:hypothetical protein